MPAGQFLGYVGLAGTLKSAFAIVDSTGTPKDPSTAPNYRIYNGEALVTNGTGSLSKLDTATVTGATNASPIAITTSAAHGLQTGNRVIISDVTGNTAANGEFTITRTSDTTFTLDGSTGNGAYVSGGTVHVAGLYSISHSITAGDGFEAGKVFQLFVTYTISATVYSVMHSFQVV